MLIYDIEIVKAVPSPQSKPNGEGIPGIEYCGGWGDKQNMGVSCIGAYDYTDDRYRVFMRDNFAEFQKLVDSHDLIVGFNSLAFDNVVCAAAGIKVPDEKSYDLLVEIWDGAGVGRVFAGKKTGGFGLDACCKANFGTEKSGNGAFAPVDFQRGNFGALIDYCLNDVTLTKQLLDRIQTQGHIIDPRNTSASINVRSPRKA